MKRTNTPQYKKPVVDIRVAKAKRLSIKFLEELRIEHNKWDALSLVRDFITFYDPTNPQRDHEALEKVMKRYKPLVDLIQDLKESGLL
jgi:hypothetical protein